MPASTITGRTPEERATARQLRTRRNRSAYYMTKFQAAAGAPRRQVEVATHYLRAVADDLDVTDMTRLAQDVVDLADRHDGNDDE